LETKKLLLAAVLSLAVMVAWGYLFPPPEPQRQPLPEEPQGVERPEPERPIPDAKAPLPEQETAPEGVLPQEALFGEDEQAETQIGASREARKTIEADGYRAVLTNQGAQLVSFQLRDHENSEGGPVDLVRARTSSPYPFGVVDSVGNSSPLNEVLFESDQTVSAAGEPVVTYRYRGPEGEAEKQFVFRSDGLLDVEVRLRGERNWAVVFGPGLRNPGAEETDNRFSRRSAAISRVDGLDRLDPNKVEGPEIVPATGVKWVGLQDNYFLTAIIPSEGLEEIVIEPAVVIPGTPGEPEGFKIFRDRGQLTGEESDLKRELYLWLRPDNGHLAATAYLGPKQYNLLASFPYGLEDSIQLGWFRFLSLPLLAGLRWIYQNVVANYGWAIIMMTILIRLVLFPLTHKSTVSMQKMQEVNPKVQAIRQKYRSKLKDKQGRPNPEMQRKMNEETMALYKTEGVNPAGGCLPMLLQIPVLFAFYSLLSTSIELRHAPWILWIQDLSAKDPYYVLPIIMGATQFIQQKMTPSAGDPMQRKMFALMPIFFTILFLGFPSGLVLYWLTNNVLGIGQQYFYKRMKEAKASGGTSKKVAEKSRRGGKKGSSE
jgi:YidC/Oxa1 family membrane protein insertase